MTTTHINPNDRQVGGGHYRSGFQHWDFAAGCYGPGYFKGVITKYVTRWRDKGGLQDLDKAQHYLEKLISINWETLGWTLHRACPMDVDSYARINHLTPAEALFISMVTTADTVWRLRIAQEGLAQVQAEARAELGAKSRQDSCHASGQGAEPQAQGYVDQG